MFGCFAPYDDPACLLPRASTAVHSTGPLRTMPAFNWTTSSKRAAASRPAYRGGRDIPNHQDRLWSQPTQAPLLAPSSKGSMGAARSQHGHSLDLVVLSSRTLAHPDTIVDSGMPSSSTNASNMQWLPPAQQHMDEPADNAPGHFSRSATPVLTTFGARPPSPPHPHTAPAARYSGGASIGFDFPLRTLQPHHPSHENEGDVPRGPGGLLFAEGCGTGAAASHAEALEPWEQETTECRSQHSSICPAGSFPFRRDGTLASPDAGMVALPSSSRADRVSSPSFLSTLEQRTHEQLRSKRSPPPPSARSSPPRGTLLSTLIGMGVEITPLVQPPAPTSAPAPAPASPHDPPPLPPPHLSAPSAHGFEQQVPPETILGPGGLVFSGATAPLAVSMCHDGSSAAPAPAPAAHGGPLPAPHAPPSLDRELGGERGLRRDWGVQTRELVDAEVASGGSTSAPLATNATAPAPPHVSSTAATESSTAAPASAAPPSAAEDPEAAQYIHAEYGSFMGERTTHTEPPLGRLNQRTQTDVHVGIDVAVQTDDPQAEMSGSRRSASSRAAARRRRYDEARARFDRAMRLIKKAARRQRKRARGGSIFLQRAATLGASTGGVVP